MWEMYAQSQGFGTFGTEGGGGEAGKRVPGSYQLLFIRVSVESMTKQFLPSCPCKNVAPRSKCGSNLHVSLCFKGKC